MRTLKKIIYLFTLFIILIAFVGCSANVVENDELSESQADVEAKLVDMANNGGYELTYTMETEDGSDYATVGANKNVSWYYTRDAEVGIAFEKSNNLTLVYQAEHGVWEYKYAYEPDEETKEYEKDLTAQFSQFLQAYEFNGILKKRGTAEIVGRECNVYDGSISSKLGFISKISGIDLTWTYYIDIETGICLKYVVSSTLEDNSNDVSFEVVDFKMKASGPELRRPKDVYPINGKDPNKTGNWNFLAFVGLRELIDERFELVSDDNFHSSETLSAGSATYYFKVLDVFDFDEASFFMKNYYEEVVTKIKESSDDKKCFVSDENEKLVEAKDKLDELTTLFELVFVYHDQLYALNIRIEDETFSVEESYLLEISVNRASYNDEN